MSPSELWLSVNKNKSLIIEFVLYVVNLLELNYSCKKKPHKNNQQMQLFCKLTLILKGNIINHVLLSVYSAIYLKHQEQAQNYHLLFEAY